MNFLKKTMIVLSATLALWGCSDDDESTNGGISTISLSTQIIQMNKDGGDATVTVTSSGDWRLSGVSDWAHPSITSGKNGDVVTFTIDANSMDEKRTATFKFFTGSSVIPLQVESEASYIMNLLSDAKSSISKDVNSVKIELNTNIADLAISYSNEGEKWLSFDKRVDFGGKTILIFNATKNDTYKNRSTTITLSSPLTTKPVIVDLTQKQTDAIIPETSTFTNDLAARTISFKLRYNTEYTITIPQGQGWITDQTTSEPQIGDDGLSTVTLTYKLKEATITRKGTIHIAATTSSLTSDVVVFQKDPNAVPIEIPDNILRSTCISNGWVLPVTDNKCIILEAGLEATTFSNTSYYNKIADLTGIENFPNLTSLSLGYCDNMKKLDISKLHKVSSLSFNSTKKCEEYNLGDNPITQFSVGGLYAYLSTENIKIISSKVTSIDLSLIEWYVDMDKVTSIDVSECPALNILNINRSNKVKTLYLKQGQTIPNLIKNEATAIVYK